MTSPTPQLVMRAGPNPGKNFTLSKNEIVLGRDVSADIVINAAEVSRRHTRLRLEAGQYIIDDLGSTNGTFVNGQRINNPQPLRPGDIIMLGEAATLVYEISQFDPSATVISAVPESPAPAQPPMRASQAPPQITPSPQAYSGQVPSGPIAPPVQRQQPPVPDARRGGPSWLWAGAGCVLVMLCFMVVGVLLFDMMNLYCTPPFDALFSFLYTCP
jgi:predicted component of type VI protein secretion system